MKKGNVSPIVLFILMIAVFVSIISFFFSIAERIITADTGCDAVILDVQLACHTGSQIRIDLTNTGVGLDSLVLLTWGEVEREITLPNSDLASQEFFRVSVPYTQSVNRIALIPTADGEQCRSRTYVFEEVSC